MLLWPSSSTKRQAATARAHSPSSAYPGASLRRAQGAKPSSAYAPQIPSRVGRSPAPQLDAIRPGADPGTGPPGGSASSTPDPPQSIPRSAGSTAAPAPPSSAASESRRRCAWKSVRVAAWSLPHPLRRAGMPTAPLPTVAGGRAEDPYAIGPAWEPATGPFRLRDGSVQLQVWIRDMITPGTRVLFGSEH